MLNNINSFVPIRLGHGPLGLIRGQHQHTPADEGDERHVRSLIRLSTAAVLSIDEDGDESCLQTLACQRASRGGWVGNWDEADG